MALPSALIDLDAELISGTNGSAVATFPDASGNGRNFTQATAADQPTLVTPAVNGLKAVRFAGDYMTNAATGISGQTAFTVFFVMALDSVPSVARGGILVTSGGGANDYDQATNHFVFSNPSATGQTSFSSLVASGGIVAVNDTLIGNPAQPFGTFVVIAIECGVDGANLVLYVNGTAQAGITGRSSTTVYMTAFHLGTREYGTVSTTDRARFTLARMLMYAGRLTASVRASVDSYLSDRYAITVSDYVGNTVARFNRVPINRANL